MEKRSRDELDILNNIEIFKKQKNSKVADDLSSWSTAKSLKSKKNDWK